MMSMWTVSPRDFAHAADGRLAGAGSADRRAAFRCTLDDDVAAKARDGAWPLLHVGARRIDQATAIGVVGVAQQRVHRYVGEQRVAIELLAVGIGEFCGLDDEVDEVRIGRRELVEVVALEQRQLLQQHGALRPRSRLEHAQAFVVEMHGSFDSRLPIRHVLTGEHAAMTTATDVHDFRVAAELVDRFGDKALAPNLARAPDHRLATAASGFGLVKDALVGFGVANVTEQRALLRHLGPRQIDLGRGRPVVAEQILDGVDRRHRALDQRMAMPGVTDGGFEHVAQMHGAVLFEDQHVGVEGAGNAGGKQTGAGNDVEAEMAAIVRDRGAGWRRALTAHNCRGTRPLVLLLIEQDHRHVAAGTVQMRFHHLQREGRRDAGIEGVAAALQDAHGDGGRDPVRGRRDTKRAVDLGAGRELIGIDERHGVRRSRGFLLGRPIIAPSMPFAAIKRLTGNTGNRAPWRYL